MQPAKILLCEESEDIREILKSILCDQFSLIIVETQQALNQVLATENNINLILLGTSIVKNSTTDLLSELKKQNPAIAIIMIIGYKDARDLKGSSGQIIKPFKKIEVLETITSNLALIK